MDELKDMVPARAERSLPAFNVVTGSYDLRSLNKPTLLKFKTMRCEVIKYIAVPRATAVDRFGGRSLRQVDRINALMSGVSTARRGCGFLLSVLAHRAGVAAAWRGGEAAAGFSGRAGDGTGSLGRRPPRGSLPADKYTGDDLLAAADLEEYKMKVENDRVWPTSPRQAKFGSRLRQTLEVVISTDSTLANLSRNTGFGIEEVRMSPDLQKAFILWDAFPRQMDAAERGLNRNMNRMRAMASKRLGAKFMPWLEFRRNELTGEQVGVAQLLEEWEAEMAETGEVDVREAERKEWSIDVEPPERS
eukprot:jgi/Tetstr1/436027/TSEL_024906.t1